MILETFLELIALITMRNRPQVLVICKNQIDYNYQVLVIEKKTVNIIRTLYIFIVVNICFTKKKKKKDVIGIHIPNQKKQNKLKYADDSNLS